MVVGVVIRSHAGGYTVYSDDLNATITCAARGRLKKEGLSIVTGDRVELSEITADRSQAVITARLERRNLLSRPPIANVDQVLIVQSLQLREWSPYLCDRYLVHFQLELPFAPPLLCLNKCDLSSLDDVKLLQSIYTPLGYRILVVSALTGQGMDELSQVLAGRISVLTGPSGVGKSSLLNHLAPHLSLEVNAKDDDTRFGRHTTTCSELYGVTLPGFASESWIGDTPGFSLSELTRPEPIGVARQFPEISKLAKECRFDDCLHLVETGCHVLANLERVNHERYESYKLLLQEAQDENKLRKATSQKVESTVKMVGSKRGKAVMVPKLAEKYRGMSRRKDIQNLKDFTKKGGVELDDEETAEEDAGGEGN
jgi:ribosome biogenesis GTPase